MRRIFIPYELTPLHLANFTEVSPTFKRLLPMGKYPPLEPSTILESALSLSRQALSVAQRRHKKESEAIIHLFQADLLWRLERWEESLDATRMAVRKFEIEISRTVSYNQAIAVYFEGMLHYILHADEKAILTFIQAQEMLQENKLDWSCDGEDEYAENCQDVAHWISQLLQILTQSLTEDNVMIVPVYEYGDPCATIKALVVPLATMHLPTEMLGTHAAHDWIPLEIDTAPLLRISPGSYYFALKIKEDKEFVPESRAGDTVLMEALLPTALTAEELRNTELHFVRRPDGKIIFKPLGEDTGGFVGVPRVLIKGTSTTKMNPSPPSTAPQQIAALQQTAAPQQIAAPQQTANPKQIAAKIAAEIRAWPVQSTPAKRVIRRKYSQELKDANPEFILDLARELLANYGYRGVPYELLANHSAAFQRIGAAELEELGQGINSWQSVDVFARILAGPAWLHGQVPAELIHKWAHSPDRWWRRAALVSTVALNTRSHGGQGDTPRTLAVCRLLVADHDDTVLRAMSRALCTLVPHDPDAVRKFIGEYEDVLAARVKREVRNKLTTGLKNPRRKEG